MAELEIPDSFTRLRDHRLTIVYHSVVDFSFIRALLASEEANSGAFIAASFSEPILPELRGLAKILVVSMSEACFVAATISAPENYRKPTGEASL